MVIVLICDRLSSELLLYLFIYRYRHRISIGIIPILTSEKYVIKILTESKIK